MIIGIDGQHGHGANDLLRYLHNFIQGSDGKGLTIFAVNAIAMCFTVNVFRLIDGLYRD